MHPRAIVELQRAVYEQPGELRRRRVLADALLEAGDPRGEFIALQLETSARSRKRAAKLLARHRVTWLGALAPAVVEGSEVWRGGFPVSAAVQLDGTLVDAPEWSTFEALFVVACGAPAPELASPWLSSLRRVWVRKPVNCRDPRARQLALASLEAAGRLRLVVP